MPLLTFAKRLLIINESKAVTERKRISWIHPPVTCLSTVCMVFHTAGLHCCLKALNTKWLGFNNSQSSQRLTRQWRRVLAPALLEVLKAAPLKGAGWYFVHLLKVRGCEGKLGGTDNNASRRVPDSKHLRKESEKTGFMLVSSSDATTVSFFPQVLHVGGSWLSIAPWNP